MYEKKPWLKYYDKVPYTIDYPRITMYEALNKSPLFKKTDLSCLRAAFSGADILPRVIKERFEEIVKKQGGTVNHRSNMLKQ